MAHDVQRRMAPETWEQAPGRATPCRAPPEDQLCGVMLKRRAARAARLVAFTTLAAVLAGGCAQTDLGSPCHLQDANGGELQPMPGRDYLYLGSGECESFACLATGSSQGAYCTQPCTGAGGSCPSGLTCAQLSLSPGYLNDMKARLPPDQYQALFGQLTGSSYCVRAR